MENDNDDNVYVIQLYHPSHTSRIGLLSLLPPLFLVHMTKSA